MNVIKINRPEVDITVFLNLDQMIELRIGTIDEKFGIVLTMSDGDEYPLTAEEFELVLETLYGDRANMVIESLKGGS